MLPLLLHCTKWLNHSENLKVKFIAETLADPVSISRESIEKRFSAPSPFGPFHASHYVILRRERRPQRRSPKNLLECCSLAAGNGEIGRTRLVFVVFCCCCYCFYLFSGSFFLQATDIATHNCLFHINSFLVNSRLPLALRAAVSNRIFC